jgi:sulfate transport system permease protein
MAQSHRHSTTDNALARRSLIVLAMLLLAFFIVAPLIVVFVNAFAKGVSGYWASITEPDARAAIELTLLAAAAAVPLNTFFGIVAAWSISKFDFPERTFSSRFWIFHSPSHR